MTKTDKINKIYIDYINFVITNNYCFRYTDIATDLGISLDYLCNVLNITYTLFGTTGYSYYNYGGKEIRSETKYIIKDLGNIIYQGCSDGDWYKFKYDENSNKIYKEDSNGYWSKYQYDDNGNKIYQEHSDGYWCKFDFDNNGNIIYMKHSDGDWYKWVYGDNGKKLIESGNKNKVNN